MTPWGYAKETDLPLWKAWLTYPLYLLAVVALLLVAFGMITWDKIQSYRKKGHNG